MGQILNMKNIKTIFLTRYILSLKERTRIEKQSRKFGFDWIIYNLAIQKEWKTVRLPFHRASDENGFKTKTEAEFGIDLAFLSKEGNELIIFVLKDEPLKNKTWINNGFEADLRMASSPEKLDSNVKSVKVVLAYNKDEDSTGIALYDNFVLNMSKTIQSNISIFYERWNITKIVEEVEKNLMTPDLVPQHLTGILNYLCAQVSDFEFASEEWNKQLIPNWKGFLNLLLSEDIDEKRIMLIPVALSILNNYLKKTPDAKLGWIDIIEWSMLHLWSKYRDIEKTELRESIWIIWNSFYLVELQKYVDENEKALLYEHGISSNKNKVGNLSTLNDVILVYDIIGKIGILNAELSDRYKIDEIKDKGKIEELMYKISRLIKACLRNNPATLRPLIDLHHIYLFFIWVILYQTNEKQVMVNWFNELRSYLMVRRIGNSQIPFIEGGNNIKLVAEFVSTQIKPYEYIDDSSYLLTMLFELTFCFDKATRADIQKKYFKHIVLGVGDDDTRLIDEDKAIDLQSWEPSVDWDKRVLLEKITDGVAITTANFMVSNENIDELDNNIKEFVKNVATKFPPKIHFDIPQSVYFLACIKNKSPLPPLFWRGTVFPEIYEKLESNKNNERTNEC